MKKDPLLKLYDKTPPKALAVLAIGAILREDEGEHDKILSAVPKATYQIYHQEFINHSFSLMGIVQLWSLSYWRTKAHQLIRSGCIMANPDMPSEKMTGYYLDAQKFTSTLRVLDAALDAFTDETGQDAAMVREWAGSPKPDPAEPLSDAEQAEMQAMLTSWRKLL